MEYLDEKQLEVDHLKAAFDAYADSSLDMLKTAKRMLESGLYKEAEKNAEDFAQYAYCADKALRELTTKMQEMDNLIDVANASKGAAKEDE